jgi:TRAP-type uncharacterized transport system substrate-binding protein
MKRRQLLQRGIQLGAIAPFLGLAPLLGHAPYPQWSVYRQRHLIILTSKADTGSFPLGKAIAETLATYLPDSEARVSRAPDWQRVASLLTTEQIELAVMPRWAAVALAEGRSPFQRFEGANLRSLIDLGDHVLVCRANFSADHARLVADTLNRHSDGFTALVSRTEPMTEARSLPIHPGALPALHAEI